MPLPEIELQPSCLLHYHQTIMTSHTPSTTLTSASLYEKEFVATLSLRLISHSILYFGGQEPAFRGGVLSPSSG